MINSRAINKDTRYSPMPLQIKVPIHPSGWTCKEFQICSQYNVRNEEGTREIERAEKAVKVLLGNTKNVYLYESGSAALLAVLLALNLPLDSEVLLTSFNCPSVVEAIVAANLSPVFFDILPDGTPCPDSFREALSVQSRVVLVTHLFGRIAPSIKQLLNIAGDAGLYIIDDAAQSLGSYNESGFGGTYGLAGILSFGRTKPLSCWGGGAIVTSDSSLQQKLRWSDGDAETNLTQINFVQREIMLRSWPSLFLGMWKALGWLRALETDTVQALLKQTGTASCPSFRRIAPLHAQLLVSQLPTLEARQQQGAANAQWLREHLSDIDDIVLPEGDYPEHVFTHFFIRLHNKQRYNLASHLSLLGVQTTWFYYPLHLLPYYIRFRHTSLPLTEEIWPKILALPCRDIHLKSLQLVCKGVRSFYGLA